MHRPCVVPAPAGHENGFDLDFGNSGELLARQAGIGFEANTAVLDILLDEVGDVGADDIGKALDDLGALQVDPAGIFLDAPGDLRNDIGMVADLSGLILYGFAVTRSDEGLPGIAAVADEFVDELKLLIGGLAVACGLLAARNRRLAHHGGLS